MKAEEKVKAIEKAIDEKKGYEISNLFVGDKTTLCEYFVFCSANSNTQVKAISDNIVDRLQKLGEEKLRIDGFAEGKWIVIDYSDVIVHIYQQDIREKYDVENFWTVERK